MTFKKLNQQGVVSFLAVIFISLLLTIITTGYIRISINEQRQASDFDQSSRAYFAAEAGVEEILRQIGELPSGDISSFTTGGCNQDKFSAGSGELFDGDDSLEVTCAIVEYDTESTIESTIRPGQTAEISLLNADPSLRQVAIRWHIDENYTAPSFGSVYDFVDTSTWVANGIPALMRASFISFPLAPGDGRINADDLYNQTVVLWPQSSGDSHSLPTSSLDNDPPYTPNARAARCNHNATEEDGFRCEVRITGINAASRGYVLNLKPYRFTGTLSFEVIGYDSAGAQVALNNKIIDLDVTARSGDIFRRVSYSFDGSGDSTEESRNSAGYDYALFGENGVCKLIPVTRNSDGSDASVDATDDEISC